MSPVNARKLKWPERDLNFLIDTAAPERRNKRRLRQIITEDEDFRHSFITDEKVFRRVMNDQEIFLKYYKKTITDRS